MSEVNYVDITNECTFQPTNGSTLSGNTTVNILYNGKKIGETVIHAYNNNEFNSPYNVSESITDCSNMFNNCRNLNSPITMHDNVTNCTYMFYNCWNFNQFVTIPNNVTNCRSMFSECHNFNQPITIPDGITDCSRLFGGCVKFNHPVTIPNNVTNCEYLFYGCSLFNQPVTIPDGITSCEYLFGSCRYFNQPIIIPNNVINCQGMFASCWNFNQPIIIPNNVINCQSMFTYCQNFNQPIIIPNKVTDCSNLFRQCYNFNQPVIIPESVTNVAFMFSDCFKDTYRPNRIPNQIINADGFYDRYNYFNEPLEDLNIPEQITSLNYMFNGCYHFNQSYLNVERFNQCLYAFANCWNLTNVTVKVNGNSYRNYGYMFQNCRNLKTVIFNNGFPFNSPNIVDNCNNLSDIYVIGEFSHLSYLCKQSGRNFSNRLNIYTEGRASKSSTYCIKIYSGIQMTLSEIKDGSTVIGVYNTTYNTYIYNYIPEGVI